MEFRGVEWCQDLTEEPFEMPLNLMADAQREIKRQRTEKNENEMFTLRNGRVFLCLNEACPSIDLQWCNTVMVITLISSGFFIFGLGDTIAQCMQCRDSLLTQLMNINDARD